MTDLFWIWWAHCATYIIGKLFGSVNKCGVIMDVFSFSEQNSKQRIVKETAVLRELCADRL